MVRTKASVEYFVTFDDGKNQSKLRLLTPEKENGVSVMVTDMIEK